jgi:competence protein ComEA
VPSFTLSRRRALVVLGAALAVVLVASRLLSGGGPPASTTVASVLASPPPVATAKDVVVDVEGAVRRPGVYRLRTGARVADAIARAGGATAGAAKAAVNLAAPVADGAQIVVPERGRGSPGALSTSAAPAAPVSLSSATIEQLDALPGVGPVTAQKIVDYRAKHGAFRSVDELDAIPGIGPARLETLRELVVP